MNADPHFAAKAGDLRRTFDRSFAEARTDATIAVDEFLAIRIGMDPHALRISEIAGLFVDKKITRLPSPVAELRGIAGFRGATTPVYELGALLGYSLSVVLPRWLVIAAEAPIALLFDGFDGHFRVARSELAAHEGAASREFIREVVPIAGSVRPIVHLGSVIEAIRKRIPHTLGKEER